MKVIAFGHRSRVGKDTAGTILADLLRQSGRYACVAKRSFAAPLKAAAHVVFGCYGLETGPFYETHGELRTVKLPGVGKSPVDLWIELGMAVRGIHEPTWIDAAMRQDCDALVLTDLRFPNEFEAVQMARGWCVKVENPSVTTWQASDHGLKDHEFDFEIMNDRDLAHLRAEVLEFATRKGLL